MKAQIIEKNGRKAFAVIPYKQYLGILEALEDYEDLKLLRKAKTDPRNQTGRPFREFLKDFNQSLKKKTSNRVTFSRP